MWTLVIIKSVFLVASSGSLVRSAKNTTGSREQCISWQGSRGNERHDNTGQEYHHRWQYKLAHTTVTTEEEH